MSGSVENRHLNFDDSTFERWWNDWIRLRRQKPLPKHPVSKVPPVDAPLPPGPDAAIDDRTTDALS